jgi:hypothetical protein
VTLLPQTDVLRDVFGRIDQVLARRATRAPAGRSDARLAALA